MAIVLQMKAVSTRRLYKKICFVTVEESEKIKSAVKASLDGTPNFSGTANFLINAATEPEGDLQEYNIPAATSCQLQILNSSLKRNTS